MRTEGSSGRGWLTQGRLAGLIILLVLVIDQWIKIAVKTQMYMHEKIHVTDWFYILFTENPGMAFGWEFFDKLFLTSFRIIAVAVIAYLLYRAIRKGVPTGFVVCLSLVLAGAAGNIIDCVFYGLIFNNPPAPFTAHFVPFGTGYESVFHGRVVDILFSHHRHLLAGLDAMGGRGAFHLFQSHIQFCGCSHQLRYHCLVDFLS